MEHTTSVDGTRIAYRESGSGTPVLIVGGAFSRAADADEIAAALVAAGLRAVTIDRRARGESGDTSPYAAMPSAELVIVPESRGHRIDPDAAARIIADRLDPTNPAP